MKLACPLSFLRLAIVAVAAATVSAAGAARAADSDKVVLLIANGSSPEPGVHEYEAGVLLLQKSLSHVPGLTTRVSLKGWPEEPSAFDGVAAIVIYGNGGAQHVALQENRLEQLDAILAKGVGLGLLHHAVEPTKGKEQEAFLRWIGGAFETQRSVAPTFEAVFDAFPIHPIANGVKEFKLRDEWFYRLRFVNDFKLLTPLLVTVPSAGTLSQPGSPSSASAAIGSGEPQIVAWAFERPTGGRGLGFTGGHFQANWGHASFRKLVLNGIVWLAQIPVPPDGIESEVSAEELQRNPAPEPPRNSLSTNTDAAGSPDGPAPGRDAE